MPSKYPQQVVARGISKLQLSARKDLPDKAATICREWLARQGEQDELAKCWQRLEAHLILESNWLQLSDQEAADIPEAAPLDAISAQLDELCATNKKLLTRLPKVSATTKEGLAHKVLVALALIPPEENKVLHLLLHSILQDIGSVS